MADIHPTVWVSLAIATGFIAWFLGSPPGDKNRERQLEQIEKVATSGARISAAVLGVVVLTGLAALIWQLF